MAKEFKITLNYIEQQVYFCGSVVSGTLSFTLEEAKSFKYVKISLTGKGHVHWTETRTRTTGSGDNQRTETETVSYTSNETYVEQFIPLWTKEQSPTGTIGPGSYKYPFQFTIPPNCPSSFQGTVGRIQYVIQGRIGTGLFRFDHRVEAPILVNQIVDINQPSMLVPVRRTKTKEVGLWCCAAGNINFTAEISRTGFCVNGDTVPLRVTVENGSSREISVRASIIQQIRYYAQGSSRSSTSTIALVGSRAIEPHKSDTVVEFPNLQVPKVQPTLFGSTIIKVYYELKVWAVVPWSLNPSILIPIVIGSVPFQGTNPESAAAQPVPFEAFNSSQYPTPSAPELFEEPGVTTRLLPNDNPPSYESATKNTKY